jgi:hypothetical protein
MRKTKAPEGDDESGTKYFYSDNFVIMIYYKIRQNLERIAITFEYTNDFK